MKKIITITLGLFLGLLGKAQEEFPIVLDQVSAFIGNQAIFKSSIDIQLAQMNQQGIEVNQEAVCYVWQEQLFERLLIHRAEIDSVDVTDEEVNGELDRRMNYMLMQMGGSEVEFQKYYGKSIREFKEEVRDKITSNLKAQKVQRDIASKVTVSPKEVQDFYNAIPKDSLPIIQEQYKIGQIIIEAKANSYEKTRVKKQLEEIRNNIINGGDFGLQALLNSDDPGSAKRKGDLGFLSREQLVPEFSAVAFRLQPGEISPVIESPYGYHIIQMIEKKGNLMHCRHILKMPGVYSYDVELAQAKADSIVKAVQNGADFAKLASHYSDDKQTKTNGGIVRNPQDGSDYFQSTQLDQDMFFSIQSLKVGEVSKPFLLNSPDGGKAIRILFLAGKEDFHAATIETDYEKIKAAALEEKRRKTIEAWVLNHLEGTYIKLPEEQQACSNLAVWYKHVKK